MKSKLSKILAFPNSKIYPWLQYLVTVPNRHLLVQIQQRKNKKKVSSMLIINNQGNRTMSMTSPLCLSLVIFEHTLQGFLVFLFEQVNVSLRRQHLIGTSLTSTMIDIAKNGQEKLNDRIITAKTSSNEQFTFQGTEQNKYGL